MLKKTLATCAILLSAHAFAASAPDCSQDKDKKIASNLFLSLKDTKYKNYSYQIIDTKNSPKIRLLTSVKATKEEKKYLMERRSKQNGDDKVYDTTKAQYMGTDIYKQYYEIELSGGEKIIAEFFSIPHYCAVDLNDIYFVSDTLKGFTPSFLDNTETPY